MFLRILRDSFFRQKRRKVIVLTAVALGTAAAAALGDIALDIGDKMSRELKTFGANLVLLPRGGGAPVVIGGEDVSGLRVPSYLDASDLPKVKDNFWKNNVLALAPSFDVPARVRKHESGQEAGRDAPLPRGGQGSTIVLRGTWFERSLDVPGDTSRSAPGSASGIASGEHALHGVRALNPYWGVEGRWPDDRTEAARSTSRDEVLVGRSLAATFGWDPLESTCRHASLSIL